jgi:hypothetical protein
MDKRAVPACRVSPRQWVWPEVQVRQHLTCSPATSGWCRGFWKAAVQPSLTENGGKKKEMEEKISARGSHGLARIEDGRGWKREDVCLRNHTEKPWREAGSKHFFKNLLFQTDSGLNFYTWIFFHFHFFSFF